MVAGSRPESPACYAVEGRRLEHDRVGHGTVTVRDGRIVQGGSPGCVWRLADDEILIPAFHDHHTHLAAAFQPARGPDLVGIARRADALEALRRWIREHPGEEPVLGEGWDESAWDDPRPPTRRELDAIAPARPVALRRVCGHLAVANRAALDDLRAGGPDLEPEAGILTESLALLLPVRWPATPAERVEGVLRGQEAAARSGVVGIDEMGRRETYEAYRQLEAEGNLWLRVKLYLPLTDRLDRDRPSGPESRQTGGVHLAGRKGFLDGSIGARTAAVEEPYASGEEPGRLLWETAELVETVAEASRAGHGVALHAIGRRAVRQALDALERASRPGQAMLHRIEHAEEADEAAFARGDAAGIAWSMQPNFTARWQGEGGMYDGALGKRRRIGLNRYRSAARRGALLFGSDTMPFGPLEGLAGALDHPDPRQRLTAAEALRAYAGDGLHRAGQEDRCRAGSPADLVILRVPGGDLEEALRAGEARVVWTAAGGRIVWCAGEASAPALLRGNLS